MSHLGQRLVDFWRDAGLVIRPAVDASDLRGFEAGYGVAIPDDLRAYWLTVDGMEDDLDPGNNRFWPLGKVRPVSEELAEVNSDRLAYPDCFVFADHLIWSLGWAVRLGPLRTERSGPVFQVTGGLPPGRQVAPSFTAFVEMYLDDPYSVL